MELVDYTDADLALSIALETDPVVMAELGGPRSLESIEKVHPRRVSPTADGGMWLKIVLEDEPEPVGAIGVWWSEWQDEELWEVGWMLLPQFHGRGLGSEALGMLIERLRADPKFDVVHAFPGRHQRALERALPQVRLRAARRRRGRVRRPAADRQPLGR